MSGRSLDASRQQPKKLVFVLALLVAALMAVAAIAGIWPGQGELVRVLSIRGETVELFGRGLYELDTLFRAAGNIGSDIVSLVLAVPLLVVAAFAYRRGTVRGRLLLSGALTWPLYLYATLALGTAFNSLFLVYVAAFSASLFALVLTIGSLDLATVERRLARLPSPGIGWFLLACGVLTFIVWMMPLVGALAGGVPPRLLQTSATMVTDALDLAIITPLCAAGGILLLTGRLAAGYRIAFPLLTLLCVLGPAIVLQTILQLRSGVVFQPPEVIGPIAGFLVLAAVAVVLVVMILRAVGDQRVAARTSPRA